MMKRIFHKRNSGFGLIQAIGAMAVGLVVILGSMTMMFISGKTSNSVSAQADFDAVLTSIAHVIQTQRLCGWNNVTAFTPNLPVPVGAGTLNLVSINAGGTVIAQVGATYGTITITDLALVFNEAIAEVPMNRAVAPGKRFKEARIRVQARRIVAAGDNLLGGLSTMSNDYDNDGDFDEFQFSILVDNTDNHIEKCICRRWSDCRWP